MTAGAVRIDGPRMHPGPPWQAQISGVDQPSRMGNVQLAEPFEPMITLRRRAPGRPDIDLSSSDCCNGGARLGSIGSCSVGALM
jgi:hypothetical protein